MFLEMIRMDAVSFWAFRHGLVSSRRCPAIDGVNQTKRTARRARYEFYIPQAGGGHLPVVRHIRQIHDRKGEHSVITATDISEQKRAEAELRDAMSRSWRASGRWKKSFSLPNESAESRAKKLALGRRLFETHYQPHGRWAEITGLWFKRGPSRRAGLRCFGTRDKFRIGGESHLLRNDGAD